MRISRMQIAGICVAALLAVSAIAVRAQDQQAEGAQGPTLAQKTLGVTFVRALATAEMTYAAKKKQFGSLRDLQDLGLLATLKEYGKDRQVTAEFPISPDTTPTTETVPGYHLDLVVSGNGNAFDAALRDTNKADHGFMVFIDDHGVIYFGRPLQ